MFDGVGDGAEEGCDFLVANEVEDFLAALFTFENTRLAKLGEMTADNGKIDGQTAGDLADGGRPTTDGQPRQQSHPIRITQSLEKRCRNAVFKPIRAAGFERNAFGGGDRDSGFLAHLRNYAIVIVEVKRVVGKFLKLA